MEARLISAPYHLLPAIVSGAICARACAERPKRALRVAAATLLLGLPLQSWLLARPGPVATWLGWPDLAIAAEQWLTLAVVLAASAIHVPERRGVQVRVGAWCLVLVGVAAWAVWRPETRLASPPHVDAAGPGRPFAVVRQTAPSSCSAAAAATLLRVTQARPRASEAELARWCRTDPARGTTDLGLFRGLGRAAPQRRVVFSRPDLEGLRGMTPCIVYVGLTDRVRDAALYAELRDQCSWEPEQVHAVVLFGFEPGQALIGDPRYGFERWGTCHFDALWLGQAIELR